MVNYCQNLHNQNPDNMGKVFQSANDLCTLTFCHKFKLDLQTWHTMQTIL